MPDTETPNAERGAGDAAAEPTAAATRPAPPDRRALRNGVVAAVVIGAVFAIGLGVATIDARTLEAARRVPGALALAAVMVLTAWIAEGVLFATLAGWRRPRDVLRGSRIYLAGSFPSSVTPFASGAIPAWTWLLTLEGLSAGEAAAVVGMRAVVTGAFFTLAGAAALVAIPRYLPPDWRVGFGIGIAVLVGIATALAFLAAPPARLQEVARSLSRRRLPARMVGPGRLERAAARLAEEAASFSAGLQRLKGRPLALPLGFAATVVSRALLFGVVPVLLLGMGWRGDVGPVLLATLVVGVVGSSAPTPGGSGAAEAALAALLHASVPTFLLGAAVILWRLLTFYAEASVGALLFAGALRRPK